MRSFYRQRRKRCDKSKKPRRRAYGESKRLWSLSKPSAREALNYETRTEESHSFRCGWCQTIDFDKAQYLLWPNKRNRDKLERSLKIKLRRETDDPELFSKLYKEELIEQHGDIPEVDIVVKGETKLWFGGFGFPGDEDEYIAFLEAKYVLWPADVKLKTLEKYRKARAEGTPFHLIDLDDDEE